jgi:hypothetical protein
MVGTPNPDDERTRRSATAARRFVFLTLLDARAARLDHKISEKS